MEYRSEQYAQDPEAKLSDEIFDNYKSGDRSTWANQAVQDRAFVASVQIEETEAKALEANNQAALSINEVTPARDQVVAQLTENSPRFNSYGRENSDPTTASNVSNLMEYIWYISDGDTANLKATEDFEDVGIWAMMAYVDPWADFGKGEVMVTDVDPLTLYIDPSSKRLDTEDAAHKLIVKKVTGDYISVKYPDFDFAGAKQCEAEDIPETTRRREEDQILLAQDNLQHKYYRIIDRYTKVKRTRYFIRDKQFEALYTKEQFDEYWQRPAFILTRRDGAEEYITGEQVAEWQGIHRQYGNVIHYRSNSAVAPGGQIQQNLEIRPGVETPDSIPGSTTMITPTNNGYLIQQGIIEKREPKVDRIKRVLTIGGKKYYEDILPISKYPIQTTLLHHQRNPFPMGDVRLVRPLQQQLNKIDSLIIAYNTNITNVKAFIPEGTKNKKDMEDRWGKAGAQLFFYDDETGGVPIIVQLTQMSNALYEQRNILIQQIQRIMGAYPFLDGDSSNAPETYRATLVIQEEGQKRSKIKRKKIEAAINNLAEVVGEMISAYYTEPKVIRLLKPNHGGVEETRFNQVSYESGAREIINDLSVGRYDIIMVSGSMLPTNRWARSEYYTGLYEKGILQDASVILRESEIPNVEQVIAKQDTLIKAEQMIQGLSQEIKKLQGDLQTADRETVAARKKVVVANFEKDVNKIIADLKSVTSVGKQRINDEVKDIRKKKAEKQQSNTNK